VSRAAFLAVATDPTRIAAKAAFASGPVKAPIRPIPKAQPIPVARTLPG
jgi:hypothetical protein